MYSTLHTGTRVWHTCIALRATSPYLSLLFGQLERKLSFALTLTHHFFPSTPIPPSQELSHHKSQRLTPPPHISQIHYSGPAFPCPSLISVLLLFSPPSFEFFPFYRASSPHFSTPGGWYQFREFATTSQCSECAAAILQRREEMRAIPRVCSIISRFRVHGRASSAT